MLKVDSISFSYNVTTPILKNLSFKVPKGSIYGFLGANGAGKTTVIRLILDLLRPNSGEIEIDGKKFKKHGSLIYNSIGSLIEPASFYGHLTGYSNLKLWANYYQVPLSRINEVLELVQLSTAKNQKAKNYSQGMKQRLGIATSLLHSPKLLILDEPLNGLDPKGIKEMRSLFLDLKKKGVTIFFSSHILSEIEATCDRLCIIKKGEMKFEGTANELSLMLTKEIVYQLKTRDFNETKKLLKQLSYNTVDHKDFLFVTLQSENDVPGLIEKLVNNGQRILEVKKKENHLEDLYLTLTEN